jgi:hypothetical protein
MLGHTFVSDSLSATYYYAPNICRAINECERVSTNDWSIEKKNREQLSWNVWKVLLKNQFLDWDPSYRPSKIHKYKLDLFIDLKHLSPYLSIFFPFHIISLAGFTICRLSFSLFSLPFAWHVRCRSFARTL